MNLEEILISVWRQVLLDAVEEVKLNGRLIRVRRTLERHLRLVDFNLDGEALRGLEQNPETSSRCAQLARQGHRIMQFLSEGRYIANVVDGKVNFYRRRAAGLGLVR